MTTPSDDKDSQVEKSQYKSMYDNSSGLQPSTPDPGYQEDGTLRVAFILLAVAAVLAIAAAVLSVRIARAAPCDDPYYTWKCSDVVCIRHYEASGNNDAIDPDGLYYGGFQISIDWHKDKVEQIAGRRLTRAEAIPILLDPSVNWAIAYYLYIDNNGAGYPGYSHWRNSARLCGLY